MRELGGRALIGLAVLVVGAMAVGYAFIFRGVATAPGEALGTVDVPGPDTSVAATYLDDGTPVFVVNVAGTLSVLDARAPVDPGVVPTLVAWCDGIGAFETGPLMVDGDFANTLGFEPDGTAFGLGASSGLSRYAVRREGDRLVVLPSSTPAGGRIDAPPTCPAGAGRVLHRPGPDEVFDPSVAIDSEPPGMIWMEGTLRADGDQAVLCDGTDVTTDGCENGAVAHGIDPATIAPEGSSGLFMGAVRDDGLIRLSYALVLSESE